MTAEWAAARPRTFLHGEFYPSNVLIEDAVEGPRVRPVDWEMAGLGPGLADLAALISGRWEEAEREALALGQDRHDVAPWESEVGSAASAGACAWIAVIATVLTMSCTSAPRDRSFTGLLRPWRTGPTATAPAERCTAL